MLSTKGIEVHRCFGGFVYIEYYPTIDLFFRHYYENDFLYAFTDMEHLFFNVHAPNGVYLSRTDSQHVAFDDNGKWISPDRLIGAYRIWHVSYYASIQLRRLRNRTGRSKPAYGGYRSIRTTQERTMYFDDPDALELGVHVKGRSRIGSLPCSWDDLIRHTDKCWKTQSRRTHQYK